MNVIETALAGVRILEPQVFGDLSISLNSAEHSEYDFVCK